MLHLSKILVAAVCLSAIAGQLCGWQTTSGQQEQLSTVQQALVDEFDAAVARCEKQIGNIVAARQQSVLFLELAMIQHRRQRNEDVARLLKSVDRSDLSDGDQSDFDFLTIILEGGIPGWLESLDARALECEDDESSRNWVYLVAIQRCCSGEVGLQLVEKLVNDLEISYGYNFLALSEIRKGNQIQSEVLAEKWFVHAKAAYGNSGSHGHLAWLIDGLVMEGEIERARRLSQRIFEFANKENQLYAFWMAEEVAACSGMPELTQKAAQRIEEFDAKERVYKSDYRAAMAFARQGDYEPTVKYLEECDEHSDSYQLRLAIVGAMVKDEKAELAFEFVDGLDGTDYAIELRLQIAKVANGLGQEAVVKKSLALCRELVFELTDGSWEFGLIASAHFRFGQAEICNRWIEGITDEQCKSRALLGEVEGRFSQISK